jgi:menaquinone-dependent protoporphyrinogen oxidase
MSRILIIYASHYGQTRLIAERIAQRLRVRNHEVEVTDARTTTVAIPSPNAYDAVVLGSRVELGRHSSDVLDYIRDHREALATVPTAFFSVSMSASQSNAGDDPSGYMMATFDALDWHPALRVAFAGALPYRRYGWILRFVMKRISRSAGHTTDTSRNHELTDWTKVAAFADKIAYIAAETTSHVPSRRQTHPQPAPN